MDDQRMPLKPSLKYEPVINQLIYRAQDLYQLQTQVAILWGALRETHGIEVCEVCGGEWFIGKKIERDQMGEGFSLYNMDSRGLVLCGKAICADCLESYNLELIEDWQKAQRQIAWWICRHPKLRERFQKMFFTNDEEYFGMVKRVQR